MNNIKQNKGYSLIELLVTVALFSVIMAAALSILAVVVKNNYKAQQMMRIRQLGDNAVNVVHRSLALAKEINSYVVSDADLDGTNDTYILNFTQPDNFTNNISSSINCNINSEELTITKGAQTNNLIQSPTGINISSCTFTCNPNPPDSKTCLFTLQLSTSDGTTTETFTTNTTIRNKVFE